MDMYARRSARVPAVAGAGVLALAIGLLLPTGAVAAPPAPAQTTAPLANLAHLDFLLDEATPPADVSGHTTYRLDEEPVLVLPWTYADARGEGAFERVGGGTLDPVTGHWSQGAYNADDVARTAVVYLRHWQSTGSESSRGKAYELLRSTAYLQTTEGPGAGNVVLWMQPDGTLNASAEPVELPDPSDSGPSYWLARTIWALGEGFAAFQDEDPGFAAFLEERLALSVAALDRDVLTAYGQWAEADGVRVPAWLITDGADASAEAVLGLAARVRATPEDATAARVLRQLAEGIGAMSSGDVTAWPYGAVMPWAQSPVIWHAWGSQMPAALAAASVALGDPAFADAARADAAVFTPTLLTAGGPDNGWNPSPTDRVQIAYGADSRVQSLLAMADATGSDGFADLAAMQAAWFFGANHAGAVMYDRATGVTRDGLQPDGTVNANGGAESTIHGLLTMIALDTRPGLADRAAAVTRITERAGLEFVEAETTTETDGEVIAPESWTGESSWSGGALVLDRGERAVIAIGPGEGRRWLQPVIRSDPGTASTSAWRPGGVLRETGPAQGISPVPGFLRPVALPAAVAGSRETVRVDVLRGTLTIDGIIVRPAVSRLGLSGEGGATHLVHSGAPFPQRVSIPAGRARVYDARGDLVRERSSEGGQSVLLPAGGFAITVR